MDNNPPDKILTIQEVKCSDEITAGTKLNVYASLPLDMIQFVFEYAVKKKVR
jgi:hypothetical protein